MIKELDQRLKNLFDSISNKGPLRAFNRTEYPDLILLHCPNNIFLVATKNIEKIQLIISSGTINANKEFLLLNRKAISLPFSFRIAEILNDEIFIFIGLQKNKKKYLRKKNSFN